jgi:ketosteroid isomerase-like protein
MKRAMIAIALAAAGCGHKAKLDTSAPPPSTPAPAIDAGVAGISPGTESLAWLVGDWQSDDGTQHEHWLAAAGALYGVRFTPGGFEADIIDDAGDGGALVRWTLADGQATGPLPVTDEPKRTGDATMSDGGVAWHRALGERAPALEDADRAFQVATRDRGADGWTDFFAPDGVNWGGGRIVKGHDAIEADIAGLLGKAQLVWQPVGSRMGPGDQLGFTIGTFEVHADGKTIVTGSYQTVWKKQPDGSWKVAADAGRPDNDKR